MVSQRKFRSMRRFTLQGRRIVVTGRRIGIRFSALVDLGFFVYVLNPDTQELTYGDTASIVRQALTAYGAKLDNLEPRRQASYHGLRQVYEAVYGPWQPRSKGGSRCDH